MTKEAVVILDGRSVVVYELADANSMLRAVGSFKSSSQLVCMYDQSVYTLEPGKVQVRNFQVSLVIQTICWLKDSLIFFIIIVTRTQSTRDHILFTTLRQCWTVSRC